MTSKSESENTNYPFLSGGGEMGELIRAKDWSATSLGSPKNWPASLKQTVSMMLTTNFPVLICWGDEFIQLYNDAFRPIKGKTKHPQALGGSARRTYAEIWGTIGIMFKDVMEGQTVGFPDFMVPLDRNGYIEECYFDFSYSPIKNELGIVEGVLVICMETTYKDIHKKDIQDKVAEFQYVNEQLEAAVEEYSAINEELAAVNEEQSATNEELQESQRRLHRSEKLFKSIALNIPDSLIILIDKDHRYITVEGDLKEKMGYDAHDYNGRHAREVGPPEQYESIKHLYQRVLAGERFSKERKTETGEFLMVHFVPLKNNRDEVESGLIIALDITESKQAEERSAKLAAIIETSNDAIIGKTLDSYVTSWNDSAQSMFGYSADEMVGQLIYKLIPEDRIDEEKIILARLMSGERVQHFETKRLTKSGILLDVSISISLIKDKNGSITGLSKIVRDITAKKLEEQRKHDFVAMVSHELRTPLTTISSFVQILLARAKKEGDAFQINALTRTDVQSKKMISMIHDFLSIARLEEGKIQLDKSKFELQLLMDEVVSDSLLLTIKHNIVLEDCGDVVLNADRNKIGQVLTNLLTNAIKYSPNGGTITIGCEQQESRVKVYVKDEGVGINAEDQARLFERFYRSKNEKLRMVSGFGIGLYLVSEVLRFHNSKIELESKEDFGSTFFFVLDANS